MTVSIAMCTYNGASYLREQLESILAQTVPPDELIVCDDASTDDTAELIYSFRELCPFNVNIIVNSHNVGLCKNFENAIRNCSGDIIILADQDDIWLPIKIESIVKAFQANPHCGYVFSDADLVDEQGRNIGRRLWESIGFNNKQNPQYTSGNQLEFMLRSCCLVYGMSMAFRACYKPILLPIETSSSNLFSHDSWISIMLTSIGTCGVAIPVSLVKYRQHEKQLAGAGLPFSLESYLHKLRECRMELNLAQADSLLRIADRLKQAELHNEASEYSRKILLDKTKHLQVRTLAYSANGLKKFNIIFNEFMSGRYSRFSGSSLSAIKDLILA